MTSNEMLYKAIGKIDDKYISEADSPYFSLKSRLLKYGSIAASVLLVITVSIYAALYIYLGGIGNDDLGGNSANGSNSSGALDGGSHAGGSTGSSQPLSSIRYSKFGSLELTEQLNDTVTFKLTVTSKHEPIHPHFELYRDGITYISSTKDVSAENGFALSAPKIIVNGSEVTAVPTEIGEYTVTFIVPELSDGEYTLDDIFYVEPFGVFSLSSIR